jgi:excinuclease ABC subunit C
VFKRAGQIGRPCLLGYIGKCSAPCVGRVSPEEHRELAEDFCDFMGGNTGRFIKRLEREMREAAGEQEYERAARLRDDVQALQRALEKQAVVLGEGTDADVIALAEDPLEAAVQVFYVRGGRIRGQRGWVVDKVEETTPGELVEQFLLQMYGDASAESMPREVLVPALPPDAEAVAELLSEQRRARVEVRVPQRGDKKSLMETVERNAKESLAQHKVRRAGDLTTRSKALQEIADALDLDQAPLRVECYDVSHLQGENVVASMVVFEDGLARKSEYRRFAVRTKEGDVASIYEVIQRRFRRYLEERSATGELAPDNQADDRAEGQDNDQGSDQAGVQGGPIDPETGKPRKFAYPPNLVVVDGAGPQAAAAQRALDELGIDDIAVCGLAKRLEEVWLPGDDQPVILPRSSEGLYLLQRVRDEAHRFAITYHRSKRSKTVKESALDTVPGLGPARRQALLKHFGSVKKLREATAAEICEVPGIGPAIAEVIASTLKGEEGQ